MAEDPWCCSYDRRGEMCPACIGMNKRFKWRELHQHEQPRLSDGYTAIQFVRPGLYMVKGPGPSKHPVPSGDYAEGVEEGWNAGAAQEQRIWRMAIERYFDGTAVEDVERYVEEIRKGVEGE